MYKQFHSILLRSVCLVMLLSLPLWSQVDPRPVPSRLKMPVDSLVNVLLINSVTLENYYIVQTGDVWILQNSARVSQEFPASDIFRVIKDGVDISHRYPSIGRMGPPSGLSPQVDWLIKLSIAAILGGVALMVISTGLGY